MSIQKNIYFKSFIPVNKFKNFKNPGKKFFNNLINKTKENIKKDKNIFNSFSREFSLNFNLNELQGYKKFKRIITIGLGGSILGTQAINFFFKKKN